MIDNLMLDGHEQVLLAALMNGTAELPLSADDFSSPPNRTIFEAVICLKNRGLLAVQDELRRRRKLGAAGGPCRITEISLLPHDAASVQYALDCVLEDAGDRRAAKICERVVKGEISRHDAFEQLGKLKTQVGLPEIESAAECLLKPIVLPGDIIKGVLGRGKQMSLVGGSKSFKTWQLLDIAISLASGTDWLNFTTVKGRVLYLDFELGQPELLTRIRTICEERQITLEPESLDFLSLRGHAEDFTTLLPKLANACQDKYQLVIVDPYYKVMGWRDENKAGDIASLLNGFDALSAQTGAAVAFGAHFSKGNQSSKDAIDRVSGSGVFARHPDTIIVLTPHAEKDAYTVTTILRNHPPVDDFCVRWQFPFMEIAVDLNPGNLRQPGRPESYRSEDLIELFDAAPMSATEIVKVADEEKGIPKRRVYGMLAELKAKGRIKQPVTRGKYELV